MARIIKAPNVKLDRGFNVVEREKVLMRAEDEAAALLQAIHEEAEAIRQQASADAEALQAAVQEETEAMRQQAQQEAEAIKEQAKAEGHREGVAQGEEEARIQAAGILKEMRGMMAEGQKLLEAMFRDQEQEIRQLVCDIASRVLQAKIEIDDEAVTRIARECIHQAADRKKLRILVHPDDQAKIEAWAPHFIQTFDDIETVSIDVDARVGRGGVMIETSSGGVDGRVEKQKEIIDDALLNP